MNKTMICCALWLCMAGANAEFSGLLDQVSDAASGSAATLLEQQLGISESQLEGGLGSMFALAQERFGAGDFDTLIAAVPGAEGYLDEAKKLGLLDQPLENRADLDGALSSLGMTPETISKFLPAAVDLAEQFTGPEIGGQLRSLLAGS